MTLSSLARTLSARKLLIFDLDGTLVDSSPLHALAFRRAFADFDVRIDYATIAGLTTGAAVDRLAADAGLSIDETARTALIKTKRTVALSLIERELVAFPGSVEFVRRAAVRFALALGTSASSNGAWCTLKKIGLASYFDPVVTADQVDVGKPDPAVFLQALVAHDCKPADALVFEDAASGLEAARRAGIEAIRIDPEQCDGGLTWPQLNSALEELAL